MTFIQQDNENDNRFHAIEKIQKAMKYKYLYAGDRSDLYIGIGIINSIIYVGDILKEINDNIKDENNCIVESD